MERLIWISWRAFWVGLGASLVLIVQSLASTPAEDPKPSDPAIYVPAPVAPTPAAAGMPDLLSPAEAAQALGVSEEDVMAIITSGELQAKKIGASYRIRRAALQEYLEK